MYQLPIFNINQMMIRESAFLLLLVSCVAANTYEFLLMPKERICLADHIPGGSDVIVHFRAHKFSTSMDEAELAKAVRDADPAPEIKPESGESQEGRKRRKNKKTPLSPANVELYSFGEGTSKVYIPSFTEHDIKRLINVEKEEMVKFCFTNNQKKHMAFVIFDFKQGIHASSQKNVPNNKDKHEMLSKLESVRKHMDHNVNLYSQMETIEKQWADKSHDVISTLTYFGTLIILFIILVSWGMVKAVEKGLEERKNK